MQSKDRILRKQLIFKLANIQESNANTTKNLLQYLVMHLLFEK